jgi:hypothetical protein
MENGPCLLGVDTNVQHISKCCVVSHFTSPYPTSDNPPLPTCNNTHHQGDNRCSSRPPPGLYHMPRNCDTHMAQYERSHLRTTVFHNQPILHRTCVNHMLVLDHIHMDTHMQLKKFLRTYINQNHDLEISYVPYISTYGTSTNGQT